MLNPIIAGITADDLLRWGPTIGLALIGFWLFWKTRAGPVEKDKVEQPRFKLTLLGGNIFVPDQAPELTGIALDLRIWNLGVPSAAHSWRLAIRLANGNAVEAQFTKIPKTLRLKGPGGHVTIKETDSIDEKTKNQDIGRHPIEGIALFYTPTDKASVENSEVALSVEDIFGNRTIATKKMSEWLKR